MPEATFRSGAPLMISHTPGSAVAAGEVVVTSDTARIAHTAIAASTLGSLSTGGGIYSVTGNAAIADGKKVYWDTAVNKVTETATANKVFGRTVAACSGNNVVFECQHDPSA